MKKVVYLSLGSNLGDRSAHLQAAIEGLASTGKILAVSSIYETEPVGAAARQPKFLNCALALETELMPRQLLSATQALEHAQGRRRIKSGAPRTIDIDIVFFGSSLVCTADLVIPHPLMHARRFVLEPLAEIAPEARNPALRKTVRELRDELPPGQAVHKLAKIRLP